jgi:hypothetical protein
MTRIYNGQVWWEPGAEPSSWFSPGLIFYWLATIVAVLMLISVFGNLFISWAQGRPILEIDALIGRDHRLVHRPRLPLVGRLNLILRKRHCSR